MSLSFPSPLCTVNAASTINGVNVTAASTVTIALVDTAGVKQFHVSCLTTDELLVAATITAGLTIDTVAKTATFTAPAVGSALRFQSVVNNGKDANGVVDPSLTTTFGVYVLTTSGYRVAAFDETTEGSASFGWVTKVNALVRASVVAAASAGAGMTFSAGAYAVGANADGSIVVAPDDVKVGVLATDAQHGARGGGTQHAAASTSVAGFMSAADKTLVNGATASPTASTLAKRGSDGSLAATGLTVGGVSSTFASDIALTPHVDTYAATLPLRGTDGGHHEVTLTGNVAVATPTSFGAGSELHVFIIQGGSGSYTATWASAGSGGYSFPTGLSGTLIATSVGDADYFIFKNRSSPTSHWVCSVHGKYSPP